MKIGLAFFLSFTLLLESLFPNGLALAQSAKMFQLFNHYQEHLLESKNEISFASFLWMHYNPASDHEDASHHHENLPKLHFGQVFFSNCLSTVTSILPENNFDFSRLSFLKLPEYRNRYHFLFSLDLLNPPQ